MHITDDIRRWENAVLLSTQLLMQYFPTALCSERLRVRGRDLSHHGRHRHHHDQLYPNSFLLYIDICSFDMVRLLLQISAAAVLL